MKEYHPPYKIKYASTIGTFFLMAFLAYGFGRHFFEADNTKYTGASLILINSILVLFIGILFRKTLQLFSKPIAKLYLMVRIFEALALSSIVVNLIPGIVFSYDLGYFLAMLFLGLGSIPMCLTLYKYRITPVWLALWGAIGYAIFAVGFFMEFFDKAWSMYLLLPGALWEVTFAIWLIILGNTSSA